MRSAQKADPPINGISAERWVWSSSFPSERRPSATWVSRIRRTYIARAQLGDGQKWRQIASANPGINPNNLKVGQSITIPEGGVDAPRAAGSVGTATPVEGNAYTVQKGDTLVALSRKFYGGDGDWKRILEANRSLLKGDPASLKPGMKLTIPAKR